jgi:hypothetical protein
MKKYPVTFEKHTLSLGTKFGYLTVYSIPYYIFPKNTGKHRRQFVDCKCKCGKIREKVQCNYLRRGSVHYYCGYQCKYYLNSLPKDVPEDSKLVHLNDKINYLTIVEEAFYFKQKGECNRHKCVKVKCDCGKTKIYREDKVAKGSYKSCGCKWEKTGKRTYRSRNQHLKDKYGITQKDYELILKSQKYMCAICKTKKPSKNYNISHFHVDHDHNTNKVRGLLCNNCNTGIGLLKDDINILSKAINYLKKHK